MFSIEAFRNVGAKVLLTVFVIPFLIFLGDSSASNKKAINNNTKDIAVLQSEEKSIIRQLERMESKLDSIQIHLIQGGKDE